MSPALHRRMRLARRWLGYCVAIALVLAALVVGVASQLLPLAERHPDRIAAWLGERIGRPVAFDAVVTRWTRREIARASCRGRVCQVVSNLGAGWSFKKKNK